MGIAKLADFVLVLVLVVSLAYVLLQIYKEYKRINKK